MKKIYRERVDAESERENGLKSKMKGGYIKIEGETWGRRVGLKFFLLN